MGLTHYAIERTISSQINCPMTSNPETRFQSALPYMRGLNNENARCGFEVIVHLLLFALWSEEELRSIEDREVYNSSYYWLGVTVDARDTSELGSRIVVCSLYMSVCLSISLFLVSCSTDFAFGRKNLTKSSR